MRRSGTALGRAWHRIALGAGRLQAKLTVNAPGDRYEQEADRVADQVLRMPEPAAGGEPPAIQRMCAECEEEQVQRQLPENEEEEGEPLQAKRQGGGAPPTVSPRTEARISALRGGGRPLPEPVRSYFEPRLGRDLGGVRVHTRAEAATAAREVRARAFTVGSDIAFGAGEWRPDTTEGQRLLAHELVHTVQQAGRSSSGAVQRKDAKYHEGVLRVRWSDDYAELYRRIVDAAARKFRGVPSASMWQPFRTPVIRFHRRHSKRHIYDLNDGDPVRIHVAGFYDRDDVPGMSHVRIWHDEDVPTPAPRPTPAPKSPAAPKAPPPPPDLVKQGKIRWDKATPERVFVVGSGVTPRLIAADLYGDEALAHHNIWTLWDEKARGGPFRVTSVLPKGSFVWIRYSKLRSIWKTRYDRSTTIIDRSIWKARKPIIGDPKRSYERYTGDLEQIYDSIAIHHAGNKGYKTIKEVQKHHMDDKEMADVGYHYGVSRWGTISEGREIGVKGSHVFKGNTGKIGIVLLADLDEQVWDFDDEVTPKMEAALLQLIHYLVGRFPRIQFLGGHKEYNTGRSCPGNLAMARMARWRSHTGLSKPKKVT